MLRLAKRMNFNANALLLIENEQLKGGKAEINEREDRR
jgi:hypothetical protein